MTKPKMTREQFDHIRTVLVKKGIELTPESITKYMLETSNQKTKFYNKIKEEEIEKTNIARLQWAQYISSIQWRIKLIFFHIIWYKPEYVGRWGRLDIIKAKSRESGDRHSL